MGGNTKSSYLVLIPKESNPTTFNIYRPISLCKSYKIITKIIANRINRVLPNVVSENQGGFVPNQQIIENGIIVQKEIHTSIQRKDK